MEGDGKRTPGQLLDDVMNDNRCKTVKIIITIDTRKTKSPEPGEPSKETR